MSEKCRQKSDFLCSTIGFYLSRFAYDRDIDLLFRVQARHAKTETLPNERIMVFILSICSMYTLWLKCPLLLNDFSIPSFRYFLFSLFLFLA